MEIVKHGSFWINNDKQIRCPECNNGNVHYQLEYILGDTNKTYILNCECNTCGCKFVIKRKDVKGKEIYMILEERIRKIIENLVEPEAPLADDEREANVNIAVNEILNIIQNKGDI